MSQKSIPMAGMYQRYGLKYRSVSHYKSRIVLLDKKRKNQRRQECSSSKKQITHSEAHLLFSLSRKPSLLNSVTTLIKSRLPLRTDSLRCFWVEMTHKAASEIPSHNHHDEVSKMHKCCLRITIQIASHLLHSTSQHRLQSKKSKCRIIRRSQQS